VLAETPPVLAASKKLKSISLHWYPWWNNLTQSYASTKVPPFITTIVSPDIMTNCSSSAHHKRLGLNTQYIEGQPDTPMSFSRLDSESE